jgi:glucose-6-phosphate dehydrogenase assembly protein OpcA
VIFDLPSTTTSQVNSTLVRTRQEGGVTTLGRVLTLVIVTDDSAKTEEAIEAANTASREHPCRIIVVARGAKRAAPRLDAQIRVGGDAGAGEVVVLRLYGALADEGASCVIPLLLPDTPVVAWWPFEAPPVPAKDPIGALATRRITDAANERNPIKALEQRRNSYAPGDTDLAWTRLTNWRAMLAAALDLPPYEKVTGACVTGEADSPSTDLLAAWLGARLRITVGRVKATYGEGIVHATLERRSGNVELERPDGRVGILSQPGQPDRRVALQRRSVSDCLGEELRRLDDDEIYAESLRALPKVVRGRVPAKSTTKSGPKTTVKARSTAAASTSDSTAEDGATAAASKTSAKPKAGAKTTTKTAAKTTAAQATAKKAGKETGRTPSKSPSRKPPAPRKTKVTVTEKPGDAAGAAS